MVNSSISIDDIITCLGQFLERMTSYASSEFLVSESTYTGENCLISFSDYTSLKYAGGQVRYYRTLICAVPASLVKVTIGAVPSSKLMRLYWLTSGYQA